jgi:tetratricopeptide (TPR) repeat protein
MSPRSSPTPSPLDTQDRAFSRFRGFFATTSSAVRRLLSSRYVVGRPVVADLSLGSWRASSVARQLAAQLGLDLPRRDASRYRSLNRPAHGYADLVSYEIDAESTGNCDIDTALDLARRFRRTAMTTPFTPIIVAPRFGATWEDEDILFVTVLSRALDRSEIVFCCGDPAPPALPEIWRVAWQDTPEAVVPGSPDGVAWIPHVVPEDTLSWIPAAGRVTSEHVQLPNGWILVSPETRRGARCASRLAWDRFAKAAAAVDPSLSVYAQYHGNNIFIDRAAMTREAWAQFADGGSGIALRYMARVEGCEQALVARAAAQAQAQGMRIARHRYAEAARVPDPSASLPAPLRSALLQSRGWGLVFLGEARPARDLLRTASALLDGEAETGREYLYLLNILALAELRCGDTGAALRLEQRIEACLDRITPRDFALTYVNAINQARIYNGLRDWANAGACYERAFLVTWGLRTESDLVHTNVCLARWLEAQGRPEPALLAWVRAALHWLASSRPEALSYRIAQALVPGLPLFGPLSQRCTRWVDEISGALLHRLASTADRCARTPRLARSARVPFARLEEGGAAALSCAVGGTGWSVLAATAEREWREWHEWPDRGAAYEELSSWMTSWIASPGGVDGSNCYLVDARGGMEMAVSRTELIETCARRGVRRACFEAERLEIDDALARQIERESTLQIAPGVDEISSEEPPRARFKRYREPRILGPDEAVLVRLASRRAPMGRVFSECPADAIACLERLERAGVVRRVWEPGRASAACPSQPHLQTSGERTHGA